MLSWFSSSSPVPPISLARATQRRESRDTGLTPAQILAKLRASAEFHVGRFSQSYVLDGVVLGQGTFGCVRRCFSAHSKGGGGKRFFAAKEIRYAELKESEVDDILAEVECMRALNHQHVCHLKEAWLDGSKAILVQELLEGVDGFAAVLENGTMEASRAKELMFQLASAVSYMHSKRIVHRDIKLENIMLTQTSSGVHVKLVDFGLSTRIPSAVPSALGAAHPFVASLGRPPLHASLCGVDERLTRFCGTPHYMAPEMVKKKGYGRPVDVWAMGVTLYMLLSGETLWEDAPPAQVCAAVKQGAWSFDQAPCWAGQPAAVKDLLLQMLHPDPRRRLTAFSVCCADWLHLAGDKSSRVSSGRGPPTRLGSRVSSGRAPPPALAVREVVYSHAMMRSATFQERLESSSVLSAQAEARLSLLAKREYLHVHVSSLVNFCSAAHVESVSETRVALERLLATAVGMARRVCHADRGSLFLVVNEPARHLWSTVAEQAEPIRVAWGVGLAGSVAATGDSINVADAYGDVRFDRGHDAKTGFRTASVLCAPVPHAEADQPLIGVVQLINKQGVGGATAGFDGEDEELLADFCVHVGLALTRLLGRTIDTRQLFGHDPVLPNTHPVLPNTARRPPAPDRAAQVSKSPGSPSARVSVPPEVSGEVIEGRKRGHYEAVEGQSVSKKRARAASPTQQAQSPTPRSRETRLAQSPTRRALPLPVATSAAPSCALC